jgi:hypothetical protein
MTLLNVISRKNNHRRGSCTAVSIRTHTKRRCSCQIKGPVFIQSIKKLSRDHDVVMADKLRNAVSCIPPRDAQQYNQSLRYNHLHMHHRDLGDAIKGMQPPVRLLALNWSLDLPLAEIHQICTDRMLARAANHQTPHGDENSKRTRASYGNSCTPPSRSRATKPILRSRWTYAKTSSTCSPAQLMRACAS